MHEKFFPEPIFLFFENQIIRSSECINSINVGVWVWSYDDFKYVPTKMRLFSPDETGIRWLWSLGAAADTVILTGLNRSQMVSWDMFKLSPLLLLGEAISLSPSEFKRYEEERVVAI